MKTGKVILGVLIGTTAGALMGMLFAPQKGTDSRNNLSKTGKKYADNIKKKIDSTFADLSKKIHKVKAEADSYSQQAKNKAEKIKKENGVEMI